MKYLLLIYATDKNIADIENEGTMFIHPPNKTPSQYSENSVPKKLRCGDVNKEQDLNEIFINELNKSIRQSTRGYWST